MFKSMRVSVLRTAIFSTVLVAAGTTTMAGEGIWKAVVPRPGTMKGEFDNNDRLVSTLGSRSRRTARLTGPTRTTTDFIAFQARHRLFSFSMRPRTISKARALAGASCRARKGRAFCDFRAAADQAITATSGRGSLIATIEVHAIAAGESCHIDRILILRGIDELSD